MLPTPPALGLSPRLFTQPATPAGHLLATETTHYPTNAQLLNRLRVLVLNADMTAMGTKPQDLSWAEALTLVLAGRVQVLEESGLVAHSTRRTLPVPSVVMVRAFQRKEMLAALAHFNRWHVFLRDEGHCQYTGAKLALKSHDPARLATIDHVHPLSKGGKNAWENCVLASSAINARKGNKRPEEAGLHLHKPPHAPRVIELQAAYVRLHRENLPPAWLHYLDAAHRQWKVAA